MGTQTKAVRIHDTISVGGESGLKLFENQGIVRKSTLEIQSESANDPNSKRSVLVQSEHDQIIEELEEPECFNRIWLYFSNRTIKIQI